MFKIILISTLVLAATAYDYDCPSEDQHFFRYPYDCTKFIECNDGHAVIGNCIPGLVFDEGIQYCDFPENVECVEEEEVEEGGPVGECPAIQEDDDLAVLLPHSTDCTKFYECNWGEPVLMECTEGEYFNDELKVCDLPADSGCVPK